METLTANLEFISKIALVLVVVVVVFTIRFLLSHRANTGNSHSREVDYYQPKPITEESKERALKESEIF